MWLIRASKLPAKCVAKLTLKTFNTILDPGRLWYKTGQHRAIWIERSKIDEPTAPHINKILNLKATKLNTANQKKKKKTGFSQSSPDSTILSSNDQQGILDSQHHTWNTTLKLQLLRQGPATALRGFWRLACQYIYYLKLCRSIPVEPIPCLSPSSSS